ncbi:HAD family phosphatase [Actinomycetospora corticicola]|uniref:HAD superfamily hydrolase (TIGR01509 family) n=1 Tax=Actinomycetospora corticicola TaxID=663602 RepID=A0A7Y9DRU4_9PSEU|nr:HAD family phosphatase [Actinomycetospora corticicola]NYD34325.1 HAD superfamily hydrolase (TIGR01509 family) [Actinomycetospora corticicola]
MIERSRAVVFDLDGVLVESEHLWEEMWTRYAACHDVPWTAVDTTHVQGMSAPEWSAYLAARSGGDASACERAVVDGMVEALEDGRMEPYDGASGMVHDVAARVPVALATSAPRRLVDAVLVVHGLADAFRSTVSSAEVDHGKPAPDVYLEAARRLGVDPGDCIGVEDSGNGIRAAAAAGMTVVAIPNPSYPPKPEALILAARRTDNVAAAHRAIVDLLSAR